MQLFQTTLKCKLNCYNYYDNLIMITIITMESSNRSQPTGQWKNTWFLANHLLESAHIADSWFLLTFFFTNFNFFFFISQFNFRGWLWIWNLSWGQNSRDNTASFLFANFNSLFYESMQFLVDWLWIWNLSGGQKNSCGNIMCQHTEWNFNLFPVFIVMHIKCCSRITLAEKF